MIDNVRPAWTGAAAAMAPGPGNSRNHIIAFEVIQNDLANILTAVLNARGTPASAAAVARLDAMTNALFVTVNPEQAAMVALRTAAVTAINAVGAAITPADRINLTGHAGNLLSALNSCADNLRPGHAGLNASIGYSIDADFLPGSVWYQGPVHAVMGALVAAAPPMGAVIIPPPVGPASLTAVNVGPIQCLRLTAAHERKVWDYQRASGLNLTFVVNGGGGALNPAAQQGQQLSSTQLPTVAPAVPFPVLVMDPAGAVEPFLYT